MKIFDSDDFGANHIISDQTQSHDCRDMLDKLHYVNPNFKATLFAIPAEMTYELAQWCKANESWIELAVHGIFHTSNYECERMSYQEFADKLEPMKLMIDNYFVKGFKAPGWQISDEIYKWLMDNGYWVADQAYNNHRRPPALPAYINNNGKFEVWYNGNISDDFTGIHTHTWSTVGNGIGETFDSIVEDIKDENEFNFISEIIDEKIKTVSGEIRNS